MTPTFHDLTLCDVRPEGEGAVALTFAVPEVLAETFAFAPGQYLTLRTAVGGQDERRSYSIARGEPGRLTVGVKHVPDGAFSTAAQDFRAQKILHVMPPQGRFVWRGEAKVVLIAAGSGITPMVAIAEAVLKAGGEAALVYGNRSAAAIMFRDTLDALKDRYMGRFSLIHVLSREPQDVALLNGRVTGEKVLALHRAGALDLHGAEGVFLCGPGGMIEDVSTALDGIVAPHRIHFERFYTEGEAPRAAPSEAAQKAAADGVSVEVVLDGTRRTFAVGQGDDNVVDAAARAGLELPYSCKNGMCCTCRCKVVEGSAEMAVNYSLEPWEMEAGFILACQARPTSDRLVLDFDAA
ncbi:2Fe-2S iron-sulfur cluster-binding protein [Sagittula salina]|uniref:2Fe-2S iron-sulfur cluster binding domain-containing protein n=1 Tax=Sagittula salina TaxID=2820268 RepID=A0A940S208_9RHOB|nr:2Fe-2S iron-sulfur cluster-binding protein [Sagittula salina]MBP0481504.1 2Fe-2S iron-sulfur cluster binding domain-containing protein [Sagittula salina]